MIGFVSLASAQNVLLNSSFEFWLDSLGVRMPFAWYTSETSDSGSAVRVLDPHSGIYALKLNGTDTSAYAFTVSLALAGHNYRFSGWCKSSSFLAGSFIITWLNFSQQLVGNPILIPIYRSTTWRQYTQIVQCPDSAVLVNVNIVALPYISLTVDDVTLTDTVLASIEEPLSYRQTDVVQIYPNPAHDHFQIISNNENWQVLVYEITGKQIKTEINKIGNNLKVNTKSLADGIYFVKLIGNNKTEIRKLIVRH